MLQKLPSVSCRLDCTDCCRKRCSPCSSSWICCCCAKFKKSMMTWWLCYKAGSRRRTCVTVARYFLKMINRKFNNSHCKSARAARIAANTAKQRRINARLARVNGQQNTQTAALEAGTHRVADGDALFNISKRYNLSVADLIIANNIKGNNIKKGQILRVTAAPAKSATARFKTFPTLYAKAILWTPSPAVSMLMLMISAVGTAIPVPWLLVNVWSDH